MSAVVVQGHDGVHPMVRMNNMLYVPLRLFECLLSRSCLRSGLELARLLCVQIISTCYWSATCHIHTAKNLRASFAEGTQHGSKRGRQSGALLRAPTIILQNKCKDEWTLAITFEHFSSCFIE